MTVMTCRYEINHKNGFAKLLYEGSTIKFAIYFGKNGTLIKYE